MWMQIIKKLIQAQTLTFQQRYKTAPKFFFLLGGSSNAKCLQLCIREFLESSESLNKTEIILLGVRNRYVPSTLLLLILGLTAVV